MGKKTRVRGTGSSCKSGFFFPICVSFYIHDVLLVVLSCSVGFSELAVWCSCGLEAWRSSVLPFFRSSVVPLFRAAGTADVVNRASAIVITNY